MKIGITPFIAQNIAPPNAKNLAIFDGNTKLFDVDISKMKLPVLGKKLYSFGLMSDIHLWKVIPNTWCPETKLDSALTYFENQGCDFCVHCGDLTEMGFYIEKYTDGMEVDTATFDVYNEIRQKHNIPIYGLCGNHENYNRDMDKTLALLEEYTTELEQLSGVAKLSYVQIFGDDAFIFLGQPTYNKVMSDEDLLWLEEMLETYKDKRCFVFVHSFIPNDSGNALGVQTNSIFGMWGEEKTEAFKELLSNHKKSVLFHGHSHLKFECQLLDKNANYTTKNGFGSVHIPSLSRPRNIDTKNNKSIDDLSGSQGYVVDVYEDCIVLNGIDFTSNKPVPIGTYKIETTT